jgi:hypothetical protein
MIERKVEETNYCSSNALEEGNYSSKQEEKEDKKYSLRNKVHIREIFYRFRGRHFFPDRG